MLSEVGPCAFDQQQDQNDSLPTFEEFLGRHADVFDDLAKENGRDIPGGVERYGGDPAVGVPKLLVRSALPNLHEAECLEDTDNLPRL